MLQQQQFTTTNYMVPSNGQTHCVALVGRGSATPQRVDWRQFSIDAQNFQPQGAFVDNTKGTVPVVILVYPINYTMTVPAGTTAQLQFPAPNGQWMDITSDPANDISIFFVDFPVLPSGMSAQITNVPTVLVGGTVETDTAPMAAGNSLPYRTQEFVVAADHKDGAISGAGTSLALTPTAVNGNLRRLMGTLTGNATLAAAGLLAITITANGVQIFKRSIYLPIAAPAAPVPYLAVFDLDFDMIGVPMSAGNVTVTLSAALSGGQMDVNAYFAPQ